MVRIRKKNGSESRNPRFSDGLLHVTSYHNHSKFESICIHLWFYLAVLRFCRAHVLRPRYVASPDRLDKSPCSWCRQALQRVQVIHILPGQSGHLSWVQAGASFAENKYEQMIIKKFDILAAFEVCVSSSNFGHFFPSTKLYIIFC